jgi:DNA-directed RNA polymerase delta subunit
MEESILDKVIDSQKSAAIGEIEPQQILGNFLSNLNQREAEVLTLRYGFNDNQKRTLEEIGKKFNVTRERIRQVENTALKKIKKSSDLDKTIKPLENVIQQTLEDHGGIMHESYLIKKVILIPGESPTNYSVINFILINFLKDRLHYLKGDSHILPAWKLPTISLEQIKNDLSYIVDLINGANEPLSIAKITEKINREGAKSHLNEGVVEALLIVSKKLEPNPFNEWGLADWSMISLKRMSDKIYLVLKKKEEPMHFTEIAEKINEIGFDKKKANPATIHNELILDDKYVLVGRGIYALSEWGYKPGVVAEVIVEILKEAGEPLSREEIIEKVSKKRMVKRSTIILALMNKERFKKVAGGYILN